MFNFKPKLPLVKSMEGEVGDYSIAVLSIFSSGISVIWILLKCGIAVSFSSAVCGFLSEDPSQYCGTNFMACGKTGTGLDW